MSIPARGLAADEVLRQLAALRQLDAPWREGRVFAGVFDPGAAVEAVVKDAYAMFLSENALYPNFYPSLLQMENGIVRALAGLTSAMPGLSGTSRPKTKTYRRMMTPRAFHQTCRMSRSIFERE